MTDNKGRCPRCGNSGFTRVTAHGPFLCKSCRYELTVAGRHYRVSKDRWELVAPISVDGDFHDVLRMMLPANSPVGKKWEREVRGTKYARGKITNEQILDGMYDVGGYSRTAAVKRFGEVKRGE